jgi:hypothetical protein
VFANAAIVPEEGGSQSTVALGVRGEDIGVARGETDRDRALLAFRLRRIIGENGRLDCGERIDNTNDLRQRSPPRRPRPRDILGRGTPQEPMPQCTSASSSRVERAGPGERHAIGQTDRRRQSAGRIGNTNALRQRSLRPWVPSQ